MSDDRPCTCHPDDKPPVPCERQYALTDCRTALRARIAGLREAAELIEDYKPQILRAQKGLSVEDNIQMAIDYVLDELFKVVLAHIAELEKP